MENNNLLTWISGILAALNAALLVYAGWKKLKPEVKKMDAEADLNALAAAGRSQEFLVDRVNELEEDLKNEKRERREELRIEREAWKAELDAEKEARKAEVAAEREARRKEGDYLRRRLRESEREARDYRQWAAKLVKQVVEAGKIPAAFIPSSAEDSETWIPPVSDEETKK